MEKSLKQLIEIVYDNRKRKLRARSVRDGRWCRFPNKLRILNKLYLAEKMSQGRGDSWIASGQIEELEDYDILVQMINIKNKELVKQLNGVMISNGKVNTEMLNIIFLVKKIHTNVQDQLLFPLVKKYSHSAFITEELIIQMQNFLCRYNERRIIKIFSNYKEDDFVEDTIIMYDRLFINDINIDDILPKKPKSIRDFHTIFTRELVKIKQPKNMLNQSIEVADNLEINKEYTISVPKTTHDLIDIGNYLNICVGNGYYAEQVVKKKSSIFGVTKNGKIEYCVELNRSLNRIQARGLFNSNMPNDLFEQTLIILKSRMESQE